MKNKKPVTHVAFVIDRSGSMCVTAKDAVDGFNSQLEEVKQNAQHQDIRCSLITFNDDVYEHLWEAPAEELKAATYESFVPSGWTAMYDAMGYTIDKLMRTTDPNEEGATYLVFVISDGKENFSKHFKGSQVASLVKEAESTGQWTISYMGCSVEDLQDVAQQTGIKLDNMAAWENKTGQGTRRAMARSRERLNKYLGGKMSLYNSAEYQESKDAAVFKQISTNFQSDTTDAAANYVTPETNEAVLVSTLSNNKTSQNVKSKIFGMRNQDDSNGDQLNGSPIVECSLEKIDLFAQGNKADFKNCEVNKK